MRSNRWRILLAFFFVAFALEVCARRWLWHQIPTQLSASAVYAVVLLDLGLAAWLLTASRA